MKILLVQQMTYNTPIQGGAGKANRLLIEALAAVGHTCRVIAPATDIHTSVSRTQFMSELAERGIHVTLSSFSADVFHANEVEVHVVKEAMQIGKYVQDQIAAFAPTWILVSYGEPRQILLKASLQASSSRVVCLIHTTITLPFGPSSAFKSEENMRLLKQTAGIVTVSNYVQNYLKRWGDLESIVIPFPLYGKGTFPRFGTFESGSITMINPSAYKGITIFLELARLLPHVQFTAVPMWGTTSADLEALNKFLNIRLVSAVADIDKILAETRILLVPSLWDEAFGQITIEAMLRGIPVLASDVGGLPEAKLGVDYILPVRRINTYANSLDDQWLPIPIVPVQDVTPWLEALQSLLLNRIHYETLAMASRSAALAYVSNVTVEKFEKFLSELTPIEHVSIDTDTKSAYLSDILNHLGGLSPERRTFLMSKLRNKKVKD